MMVMVATRAPSFDLQATMCFYLLMISRSEAIHTTALEMGLPLAPKSQNFIFPEIGYLKEHISVDHAAIDDFLHQKGLPKEQLGHRALEFVPQSGRRELPISLGILHGKPIARNGHVYAPHITLGVYPEAKRLDAEALNATLRHELAHLLEASDLQLYHRPHASPRIAAALGAATGVYEALSSAGVAPEQSPYLLWPAVVATIGGSALLMANAHSLAYSASITELKARRFSKQHRDFRPITVKR